MTLVGLLLAVWFIKVDAPVPSTETGDTAAFVRDVEVGRDLKRAVWTVTGLGVFRVYVNGREVGADDVLKPGFTGPKRKHSFAYDVTGLLRRGTNRLAAEVTAGWWRDEVAVNPLPIYAAPKASGFYGMLELEYADGTRAHVEADPSWRAAYAGQTVHADIYGGEVFDARQSDDWKRTGADDWPHARHTGEFCGVIRPLEGPAICLRRDLTLAPRALYVWKGVEDATETQFGVAKVVRRHAPGDRIVLNTGETLVADFGQNAAGVPEFMARAARGVRLTGHPAEMLNDGRGEKSRGNDGPAGSAYFANYRGAKSRFEYCFSGTGDETYRPQFTFFGGRYFSFTADGTVEISRLAFVPQTSVAAEAETGSIETGRADVNRLIANCLWGMRSNYLSVPTDCPQRNERLGWAGDTQVFSDAAVYAADVYAFLSKWMGDMRDGQGDDWKFPDAFPSYAPTGRCIVQGHLFGWSDAGVIVPWRLWKHYGDIRVIRENWLAMQRFVASVAETDWVVPGQPQCADWLSDEKFERWRIDKGVGLRPGETRKDMEAYWRFLGLCHLIRDFSMMREMAAAIGKKEESARFAEQYEQAVARFRARHLEKDGTLPVRYHGMQTPAAFVLTLGLSPDDASKAQTVEVLKKALAARGNRMSTGFLGTAVLLDALADAAGDPALAYSVLLGHDFPGWLYSVDQGATTIWERWNSYTKEKGFGPVGMNSFNHYAYGAVLGWMYRTMAGIRPGDQGGFASFVLAPKPDRRLGFCKARYRSRQGVITSEWRFAEDGTCVWKFEVPAGTRAKVVLPSGKTEECGSGVYERVLTAESAQVVQEAKGYNSWPMIQAVGNRLVCAYSRGSAHTIAEGARGVWARVSTDGGMTWSEESLVADDPRWGEVTIGKGRTDDGAMLLWVRCWGRNPHHDLYRSVDGVRFEKWATPVLDPVPMQITDVIHVPNVGMMCLWFSAGYQEGQDKSWGTLVSADGGKTWTQRTVERGLAREDWPTEPSGVSLGDGRILVLARSEGATRHQFQLVSTDGGTTWRKSRTNITDVRESTPSLVYDAKTGLVSNYYYQRGARQLKRRVVQADSIFSNPTAWPEPEVLFEGREKRSYDAGNANATVHGGRHYVATYTGSETDTAVVVVPVAAPRRFD